MFGFVYVYWLQFCTELIIRLHSEYKTYSTLLALLALLMYQAYMIAMFVWTVWWIERHSSTFLRRVLVFVSSREHKSSFRPWFWTFYGGTIVVFVAWMWTHWFFVVTGYYEKDYKYYTDVYLKAVEAGFDNATCCPMLKLDQYDRLTPLEGPEGMFWAVKIAAVNSWFSAFFIIGVILWHSLSCSGKVRVRVRVRVSG